MPSLKERLRHPNGSPGLMPTINNPCQKEKQRVHQHFKHQQPRSSLEVSPSSRTGTKATQHARDGSRPPNLGAGQVFFWWLSDASLGLGIYPLDGWGMQVLAFPALARVFVGCRSGSGGLEGRRPPRELCKQLVSTVPLICDSTRSLC